MIGDSAQTVQNLQDPETISGLESVPVLNSPPEFWDGVMRRLGSLLPAHTFDAWVRPLSPVVEERGLVLRCPSPFHRDKVRERYLAKIQSCVHEERGDAMQVHLDVGAPPIRVDEADARGAQKTRSTLASRPTATTRDSTPTRPEQPSLHYDFDSFVE